ncbi:MAG: SO_0444 family Cu/Zn efflux transporter [Planctomycetes bacterium]|nr:SO_0444 family Cu/Zn efflux transporter [Planctomycetota bacterium]
MADISQYSAQFADNLWGVTAEAAPWLALGLLIAGVLKVWVPTRWLVRWLGGHGLGPIFRAALIGTPLPLCSCGVLPAAIALRRGGASRGATVSFLIATPENGADSILVSYALLGPFMTVARPIAAIFSACLAGILADLVPEGRKQVAPSVFGGATTEEKCCDDTACGSVSAAAEATPSTSWWRQLFVAAADVMDDMAIWMGIGLIAAAVISTCVPPDTMARWGSGLPAMLAILVVAVPMYICATSSTPIAAAMILAGVSPGTALVFMLAGPASNFSAIAVLRKELGAATVAVYLASICVGAVSMGLLTDWLVVRLGIDIVADARPGTEWMPAWLAVSVAVALILFAIRPLRRWGFDSGAIRSSLTNGSHPLPVVRR